MNKMTVRKIVTSDDEYTISKKLELNETISHLLTIGRECNNAQITDTKVNKIILHHEVETKKWLNSAQFKKVRYFSLEY